MPIDIYDLGLIYEVSVDAAGQAAIRMTLTAPNCPVRGACPPRSSAPSAPSRRDWRHPRSDLRSAWSKDRMSEAAKLALGIEDLIPIARLPR